MKISNVIYDDLNIGDSVTAHITLSEKLHKGKVVFECVVTNGDGVDVISGMAIVLAPSKKVEVEVEVDVAL